MSRKEAYQTYLKSDHWQVLKLSKILQEDKVCLACKTTEYVQLHHMLYRETFEMTELEDTCWLCRGCHKIFHLRAGVLIRTKRPIIWIREETCRIINSEQFEGRRKKLNKKQRELLRRSVRRDMRDKRRIEIREKRELAALKRPKPLPIKVPNDREKLNNLLNKIKPRSALSAPSKEIVFVRKQA
jgi:hypothetical protein